MPTSLPPAHEPERRNRNSLEADAWAGIAVIVAMFIIGVSYWSGHTNDANAASTSQRAGSSAASQTATKGADTTVQ